MGAARGVVYAGCTREYAVPVLTYQEVSTLRPGVASDSCKGLIDTSTRLGVRGLGHVEVKEMEMRGTTDGGNQDNLTSTRGVGPSTRRETNLTRV